MHGPRVVFVDHQDSFVHTLANYLRQTGALVTTLRFGFEPAQLDALQPTLAVLSPGPGKPADFDLSRTIELMLGRKVPLFGVCLGLQGMVEHFGGELGVLAYPMHGKPSEVTLLDRDSATYPIFEGIPSNFDVARYHSLHGLPESFPDDLRVTAQTEDGVVRAPSPFFVSSAFWQVHNTDGLFLTFRTKLRLLLDRSWRLSTNFAICSSPVPSGVHLDKPIVRAWHSQQLPERSAVRQIRVMNAQSRHREERLSLQLLPRPETFRRSLHRREGNGA